MVVYRNIALELLNGIKDHIKTRSTTLQFVEETETKFNIFDPTARKNVYFEMRKLPFKSAGNNKYDLFFISMSNVVNITVGNLEMFNHFLRNEEQMGFEIIVDDENNDLTTFPYKEGDNKELYLMIEGKMFKYLDGEL